MIAFLIRRGRRVESLTSLGQEMFRRWYGGSGTLGVPNRGRRGIRLACDTKLALHQVNVVFSDSTEQRARAIDTELLSGLPGQVILAEGPVFVHFNGAYLAFRHDRSLC